MKKLGWVILSVLVLAGGFVGVVRFMMNPMRMTRYLQPPAFETADQLADLNWSVQTTDGRKHPMSEWRGKTILLDIWTTWCAPCIAEFPSLSRLQEKLKDDSVVVIAVSPQSPEIVAEFAKKHPYAFLFASAEGTQPAMFSGTPIPMMYVIAPNGKIVAKHEGAAAWDAEESVDFLRNVANSQTGLSRVENDVRLAEQGRLNAQRRLGEAYFEGKGISKDHTKALHYYKLAAEQGDGPSATWVGYLYLNGAGIKPDPAEAARWYERAANGGQTAGAYGLGVLYQQGAGVPKDLNQAMAWFRKAAQAGNMDAQYALGYCFINQGQPENVWLPWFERAAVKGHTYSQLFLGWHYLNRDLEKAKRWFEIAMEKDKTWGTYSFGLLHLAMGGEENTRLAVAEFQKIAETRLPDAQYVMGLFYLQGLGVPMDAEKARLAFEDAAYGRNMYAMYILGWLYRQGVFVKLNDTRAFEWFGNIRRFALTKNADAEFALGMLYHTGALGKADIAEALKYYRLAAEQGNGEAGMMVGQMYDAGIGVPQDRRQAKEFLRRSVIQGSIGAQFVLARLFYRERNPLSRWRAYQLFASLKQAAKSGSTDGSNYMGFRYEQGLGVPLDLSQALYWYRQAAVRGQAEAQYKLGCFYQEGIAVAPNDIEANRWFTKAMNQTDPGSMAKLGAAYLEGKGVTRDPAKGRMLLDKVRLMASWGNDIAQHHMGEMYAAGVGVPLNLETAAGYFQSAAEHGVVESQYRLGICYRDGKGIPKDMAKARQWLQRAHEQGHAKASKALDDLHG